MPSRRNNTVVKIQSEAAGKANAPPQALNLLKKIFRKIMSYYDKTCDTKFS